MKDFQSFITEQNVNDGDIQIAILTKVSSKEKEIVANQTESLMIDLLTSSPENTKAVADALKIVNPYLYAYGVQFQTRSVTALVEEETVPQVDVEEGDVITRDNLSSQLDSALQNMQQSDIPLVPPVTSVTPEAMLSETILPNPDDREIAQRMMGARGIGSLMS